MSSRLKVTRVVDSEVKGDFYDLKFLFRDVFGDPVNVQLNGSHIRELEVLSVARPEAKKAIDKIIKELNKGIALEIKEVW